MFIRAFRCVLRILFVTGGTVVVLIAVLTTILVAIRIASSSNWLNSLRSNSGEGTCLDGSLVTCRLSETRSWFSATESRISNTGRRWIRNRVSDARTETRGGIFVVIAVLVQEAIDYRDIGFHAWQAIGGNLLAGLAGFATTGHLFCSFCYSIREVVGPSSMRDVILF